MFLLEKMGVGLTPPIKHIKATANEDIALGEALVITSGLLTKCGATAAPKYIAVGPQDEDDICPVIEVQKYLTWRTTLSAAGTSLAVGNSVTLHTDGMQVTATTTNGVAELVQILGTAVGDEVIVKF